MNTENTSAGQREIIPDSYQPIPAHAGFTKYVGPFYAKDQSIVGADGITRLGLKLVDHHAGGPGRGHGGVTMMLMDEVMGRAASIPPGEFCLTISMNLNMCNSTEVGDFLIARAEASHRSRKMIFLSGTIHAGDTLIATATGVWKRTGIKLDEWIKGPG